jgi:hypothetical protein
MICIKSQHSFGWPAHDFEVKQGENTYEKIRPAVLRLLKPYVEGGLMTVSGDSPEVYELTGVLPPVADKGETPVADDASKATASKTAASKASPPAADKGETKGGGSPKG